MRPFKGKRKNFLLFTFHFSLLSLGVVIAVAVMLGCAAKFGVVVPDKAAPEKMDKPSKLIPMRYAQLTPVDFRNVQIEDDFWKPRMETIRTKTIPDLFEMMDANEGRGAVLHNFKVVAGIKEGKFINTLPCCKVYKTIEGAVYSLAAHPDPELEEQLDDIIAIIAAAQEDDGYLCIKYQVPDPNKPERWSDQWRWKGTVADWPNGFGQFYNAGHLFEAAALHYQVTGKRNLLDVACKLADLIDSLFGPLKRDDFADHPNIEIGLLKLYRATGEERYLKLAEFITTRMPHARRVDIGDGHTLMPVTQQREAWGHCVRQAYLYTALTQVTGYTGSQAASTALDSIWNNTVGRKMYITGGIGNGTKGEQHGEDYNLPNDEAYTETCASIAMGMWGHRMNVLYGDAKYADIVELEAYNGALSGISLTGTEYCYNNKLAVDKEKHDIGKKHQHRWRAIWCCSVNLPRFITGIGRWAYAKDNDRIYVNMYVAGSAEITLADNTVQIRQQTHYPWYGDIVITVEPEESKEFDICLRIPGWAQGRPVPSDLYRFAEPSAPPITLKLNGKTIDTPVIENGYIRIHQQWNKGDTIELNLPMPVRRVYAHPNVEADVGQVALMHGPIVYCFEGTDNDDDVFNLTLPPDAKFISEHRDDLLGGVTVLRSQGLRNGDTPVEITAVPYYAWDNRETGEMLVWLAEE